jgi:uncharacterized protein (DUF433 family)
MPGTESLTEQNIAKIPLYTCLDAAQYLHLPPFLSAKKHENGEGKHRLSFQSLASLFVSSALLRLSSNAWGQEVNINQLFNRSQEIFTDARTFADREWVLKRFELGRISEADRQEIRKTIASYQSRIELNEGLPLRLFPFSRDLTTNAPRIVVLDPEIRFGKPTVKGVPTEIIADRWRAGDRPAELAEDYGLSIDEIDEALRYETLPFPALG